MTVAELIVRLQAMPDHFDVFVDAPESIMAILGSVTRVREAHTHTEDGDECNFVIIEIEEA